MITELGHLALILALFVAVIQSSVPLIGANRGDTRWMGVAAPAAIIQLALIGGAFATLIYAFVQSDFSLLIVAKNSHTLKPFFYKITGVWGNHEGSMLFWISILALFGASVAVFGKQLPLPLKARILSVQGLVAVGFITYILFTSNPFERLVNPPIDGNGLNPVLQDFGLALHPPFLYLGYVGFSISFSFAIAALLQGKVDAAWARWVRPWTLAAWIALTLGIALGSWWAYYELGWGGWWFWDPVENSSFMPWLVGTAFLHSVLVVERRDALRGWTILLGILTFSLSLLGTFLVRSGVLTSVHAFASSPARGVFVLVLLLLTVGGSLLLFASRAGLLRSDKGFSPLSREGTLLINNLLLSAAAGLVLLGTMYPLLIDALQLGKVSVGTPYYNSTFIPLTIPLFVLMGLGPVVAWKRGDMKKTLKQLLPALGAAVAAAAYGIFKPSDAPVLAAVGLSMAAWLMIATPVSLFNRVRLLEVPLGDSLKRLRRLNGSAWGMYLAHAGVAVLITGTTVTSIWSVEKTQAMQVGESVEVAGYQFKLAAVSDAEGPNYTAKRGTFEVTRAGWLITIMEPEKRSYPVEKMPTTEAAIDSHWFGDLYAVLGDPIEGQGWTTRLYFKPLLGWLWLGSLMLAFGGLISLTDRRRQTHAEQARAGLATQTEGA